MIKKSKREGVQVGVFTVRLCIDGAPRVECKFMKKQKQMDQAHRIRLRLGQKMKRKRRELNLRQF